MSSRDVCHGAMTGRNEPLYSLAMRKIKSRVNVPMIHFNNDKTCKSQASMVSFFFAFNLMGCRERRIARILYVYTYENESN
jgi:hypothetical protein